MTDQTITCPRCGTASRRDDMPAGLCPRCVLAAAAEPQATTAGRAPDPVPTAAELAPLFPAYEIQALIGRGGMGAVYRARHTNLDRLVAIKVLLPRLTHEPGFAERFGREARALARLDHPGIVRVHDFGQAGELFFLVMEYVDGVSLRELMRQGQLSAREVLAFIPQLCDALQYAHDLRVVHRDIKPENLLVDQDGRVRIADFGLAKLLGAETDDGGLTASEQVFGTPHYMSPEQLRASGTVDHRADIYSLGVVLYEMLTGSLPLGHFAKPSERTPANRGFDDVVLKSLAAEPEQRYQHARDVKRDLGRSAPEDAGARVRARREPTPPRTAGVPVGHCVALAVAVLASFLTWGTIYSGPGRPELLGGWIVAEMSAWNSNVNGIPTWFVVVGLAVAVGLAIARAFGQPPRRLAVLLLVVLALLLSVVWFATLVASDQAEPGAGNLLTMLSATWILIAEIRAALGASAPAVRRFARRHAAARAQG